MNTVQYKCPNCGAELTFDPEHQNFSCEFCDSTYTEAEMQQLYQNMEPTGRSASRRFGGNAGKRN